MCLVSLLLRAVGRGSCGPRHFPILLKSWHYLYNNYHKMLGAALGIGPVDRISAGERVIAIARYPRIGELLRIILVAHRVLDLRRRHVAPLSGGLFGHDVVLLGDFRLCCGEILSPAVVMKCGDNRWDLERDGAERTPLYNAAMNERSAVQCDRTKRK